MAKERWRMAEAERVSERKKIDEEKAWKIEVKLKMRVGECRL